MTEGSRPSLKILSTSDAWYSKTPTALNSIALDMIDDSFKKNHETKKGTCNHDGPRQLEKPIPNFETLLYYGDDVRKSEPVHARESSRSVKPYHDASSDSVMH